MKKFAIIGCLILLVACSKSNEQKLNSVVSSYIQETQLEDEAYVTIDKINFDSLNAFRISASLVFYQDEKPFRIDESNGHYIFNYQKGKKGLDLKEIPEEIKIREKYREVGVNYNPPLWVAFICNESKNQKVIKNPSFVKNIDSSGVQFWQHVQLDSIKKITDIVPAEELNNFTCKPAG